MQHLQTDLQTDLTWYMCLYVRVERFLVSFFVSNQIKQYDPRMAEVSTLNSE